MATVLETSSDTALKLSNCARTRLSQNPAWKKNPTSTAAVTGMA
jgi:hypothetical protein